MREAVFLAAAQLTSLFGMAWLALAMQSHWEQVRNDALLPKTAVRLRTQGALMLAISLGFCLTADHASMAALVWVMGLAASALAIAFALTWKPHWLRVMA